jgi:tetratricopeptide (TPR) repeat protein
MRSSRGRVTLVAAGLLALVLRAFGEPKPGDLRSAGNVHFPITAPAPEQAEFDRGVALLHSFFYEEARRIFTQIAARDPSDGMAQWGIAMTWWHPIWTPPTPEEMAAGSAAAEKALALGAATDRERGYIEAIGTYYRTSDTAPTGPVGQGCHGPVGPVAGVAAYAHAMHALFERYPDDFETQTFYALAVLAVGYATPLDATRSRQLEAAGILERLWRLNPNHPGVAHYLIHCYDYPELAARALPAARAYAAIAPWVPHALHMPSHIFTRLGMWDEAIASNLASAQAARAYAAQMHRQATESEELHGSDYLVYSYLQQARDREADVVWTFIRSVRQTNPPLDFAAAYALAAIPARCALERQDWRVAAELSMADLPHWKRYPFLVATTEYAHAMGRVRLGDRNGARTALQRMRELDAQTTDPRFNYFRSQLETQTAAVGAWIDLAEGGQAKAVDELQALADAEDRLGKNPVSPGTLLPIREQLGDVLLSLNRPTEAREAFEASLRLYPNRFRALSGAAAAASAAGDTVAVQRYNEQLRTLTAKSEGARPEVSHLRQALAMR